MSRKGAGVTRKKHFLGTETPYKTANPKHPDKPPFSPMLIRNPQPIEEIKFADGSSMVVTKPKGGMRGIAPDYIEILTPNDKEK